MYSWIWNKLPGGRGQKIAEAILLLVAVTLFMYIVVFPAIDQLIGVDEVSVTE